VATIDYALPGDVIVIDVKGYKDAAIWGDLAAKSCKLRGITAVIMEKSKFSNLT
jgi:regulator of RNase E activity RraA